VEGSSLSQEGRSEKREKIFFSKNGAGTLARGERPMRGKESRLGEKGPKKNRRGSAAVIKTEKPGQVYMSFQGCRYVCKQFRGGLC